MSANPSIYNLITTQMSYTTSTSSAMTSELDTEKQNLKTFDDMSINNYRKLSIDSDLFFSTMLSYESEAAESAIDSEKWLPLTSLRHTAQQVMIRNMLQQNSPHRNLAMKPKTCSKDSNYRVSTSSTFSTISEISTISSDSIQNQLPITPSSSEYFNELCESLSPVKFNTMPRQSPMQRERSQSQMFDAFSTNLESPLFAPESGLQRQRSCSVFTLGNEPESSEFGTHNSKTAVQSSRKVAKLLGLEPITNNPNSTPISRQNSNPRASISSRLSDTPTEPASIKRASLTPSQFKTMVDSKLKSLRRSSRTSFPVDLSQDVSLKSVTKKNTASIYGFIEVYKEVSGIMKRSAWKTKYFVLNANTLYRFDDNHPTSITTTKLKIMPATIICVSNQFSGDKWVLEVGDSHCTWYLRFHNRNDLSLWLSTLKQASTVTKYSKKSLPTVPCSEDVLDEQNLGNLVDLLPQPPSRQSYHPQTSLNSSKGNSMAYTNRLPSFTTKTNYKVSPDSNLKFPKPNSFFNFPSLAEVPEL